MKKYSDIGRELNVSDATISNWIKTGVIPAYPDGIGYDCQTYQKIIDEIKLDGNKLQQRANRLQNKSCGSFSSLAFSEKSKLIISKLREVYFESGYTLSEFVFILGLISLERKSLAKLRIGKSQIYVNTSSNKFSKFINKWKADFSKSPASLYRRLLVFDYPENETDFIGAVYESLRSVSDKSESGAYFTPASLCENISVGESDSVLDPCAGTGTMLLNILSKNHNPAKIFLRDIDETALRIAVINFVIHFNSCKKLINTEVADVLDSFFKPRLRFDYIISNPPYGAKFSKEKKHELFRNYSELSTSESFSISIFQSLKMLKSTGKLVFILPESILYVGGHFNIRKLIFSKRRDVTIRHYGKAFKGVMSSIIRLEMDKGTGNVEVYRSGSHLIFTHHQVVKNNFRPPYVISDDERFVLDKILNTPSFNLKGKCNFGLGIVTGNNKKHLFNFDDGAIGKYEPIYTGRDLFRCNFAKPRFMIDYQPEVLQQVSSLQQYRSTKVCYRFISDNIVTAFDESGRLILNSINFFILKDTRLSPKAVSAYLNSAVVSFIYRSLFNSAKVLRSHIEAIPIPIAFKSYSRLLEKLYDEAAAGKDALSEIDLLCCEMFGLKQDDVDKIGRK